MRAGWLADGENDGDDARRKVTTRNDAKSLSYQPPQSPDLRQVNAGSLLALDAKAGASSAFHR